MSPINNEGAPKEPDFSSRIFRNPTPQSPQLSWDQEGREDVRERNEELLDAGFTEEELAGKNPFYPDPSSPSHLYEPGGSTPPEAFIRDDSVKEDEPAKEETEESVPEETPTDTPEEPEVKTEKNLKIEGLLDELAEDVDNYYKAKERRDNIQMHLYDSRIISNSRELVFLGANLDSSPYHDQYYETRKRYREDAIKYAEKKERDRNLDELRRLRDKPE
jgi:hypothetical protein